MNVFIIVPNEDQCIIHVMVHGFPNADALNLIPFLIAESPQAAKKAVDALNDALLDKGLAIIECESYEQYRLPDPEDN